MGKGRTFQDLVLGPASDGQDRWHWLYTELRAAILEGRLKRGSRLPSSRSLATQYDISRGTVTLAFEQLRAEGYTSARIGGGTFVASGLPEDTMTAARNTKEYPEVESRARLAHRGFAMIDGVRPLPSTQKLGKAFRIYEPAIDLFPVNQWAKVAGRVLRRAPRILYGQGHAAGYEPLRKAVAEYLGMARGVRCDAAQVIMTSGAQQALDLVARLLLDTGDAACIEDPSYPGARSAWSAAGARIISVPVDQQGIDVTAAARLVANPKLIYTTPANQFPLGVTLTLERRLALLKWAVSSGAWIVEDDYDAEYRYFGRPVAALHSLDISGSVLYIGTFTKMLFNALRLGFLVVPARLTGAFEAARSIIDRHPPTLDQAILAEFIFEGYFGHHVRRMRQIYAERMGVLKDAVERKCGEALDIVDAPAGMRTVAWIRSGDSDRALADRARSLGLELSALSEFTARHTQRPAVVLGFAGCSPAELRRGVDLLARALDVPS